MGKHPCYFGLAISWFQFLLVCETVGWSGFALRPRLIGSLSMVIPYQPIGMQHARGSSGELLSINSVQSSALRQNISQQDSHDMVLGGQVSRNAIERTRPRVKLN